MTFKGSKRIQDNQKSDKELMEAIRIQKDLTEKQVNKLLNLSLDTFEK